MAHSHWVRNQNYLRNHCCMLTVVLLWLHADSGVAVADAVAVADVAPSALDKSSVAF